MTHSLKQGSSLSTLILGGSPAIQSGDSADTAEASDFTLALLFNEQRDPVCVGLPLDGLTPSEKETVLSASRAQIQGSALTLISAMSRLKLTNVQPAVLTGLISGLPLVAIDISINIEKLIPVLARNGEAQ